MQMITLNCKNSSTIIMNSSNYNNSSSNDDNNNRLLLSYQGEMTSLKENYEKVIK